MSKLERVASGDVVKLRSGGPAMTVLGEVNNFVKCRWWGDPSTGFMTDTFHIITLETATAD